MYCSLDSGYIKDWFKSLGGTFVGDLAYLNRDPSRRRLASSFIGEGEVLLHGVEKEGEIWQGIGAPMFLLRQSTRDLIDPSARRHVTTIMVLFILIPHNPSLIMKVHQL